jgi:cupin 2 domain-containing protein
VFEWVVVIEGSATIVYDDQETVSLKPGDTLLIPAHKKHRVISTATDKKTIWLAVHCSS